MKHTVTFIKTVLCLCCVIILCITSVPMAAKADIVWPKDTYADSGSAIVMDINTGTILYEKNADKVNFPASITKIMTGLLAVENCSLDETVIFSKEAVYKNEGNTSHIYRDVDEEMTMEQCLYAMMLSSANECAWAIGEHVAGGSMTTFVDMMNEKAKSLGCTNTHFCNPNGLPDEEHVTSAHDMALIAAAAYKNETFRIIAGTGFYTIPETNKHEEPTYCANHHKMLYPYQGDRRYLYDYCVGGKTGYTVASGHTLVTYAINDDMPLVCVIMNGDAPGHYTDTTRLLDYCFANFKALSLADYEDTGSTATAGSMEPFAAVNGAAYAVIPKDASFEDLEKRIDTDIQSDNDNAIGRISYLYGDREVGSCEVVMRVASDYTFEFHDITSAEAETQTVHKPDEQSRPSAAHPEDQDEEDGIIGFIHGVPLYIKLLVIIGAAALIVIIAILITNSSYAFRQRMATKRARRAERKRYRTIRTNEYGKGRRRRRRDRKKDLHF